MESFIYLIIKKNTISILKCKKKKKNLSLEGNHMHCYNFADVFLTCFIIRRHTSEIMFIKIYG